MNESTTMKARENKRSIGIGTIIVHVRGNISSVLFFVYLFTLPFGFSPWSRFILLIRFDFTLGSFAISCWFLCSSTRQHLVLFFFFFLLVLFHLLSHFTLQVRYLNHKCQVDNKQTFFEFYHASNE